jgi:hypothetical protein
VCAFCLCGCSFGFLFSQLSAAHTPYRPPRLTPTGELPDVQAEVLTSEPELLDPESCNSCNNAAVAVCNEAEVLEI